MSLRGPDTDYIPSSRVPQRKSFGAVSCREARLEDSWQSHVCIQRLDIFIKREDSSILPTQEQLFLLLGRDSQPDDQPRLQEVTGLGQDASKYDLLTESALGGCRPPSRPPASPSLICKKNITYIFAQQYNPNFLHSKQRSLPSCGSALL